MESNRRKTFRAAVVDALPAMLVWERNALDVEVLNESSGGLSVLADEEPRFPLEAEAELLIEDGRKLRVVIKHYAPQGPQVRIGLQRREVPVLGRPEDRPVRWTGPLAYAAVLLVGLLIGALSQLESVKRRLAEIPGVAELLRLGPMPARPDATSPR
jgi:hypothetical protein